MAQPQIDESARQYRSRHGIVILLARSSQLPPCGVFCFPYRTSLPPSLTQCTPVNMEHILRLFSVVLLPLRADTPTR